MGVIYRIVTPKNKIYIGQTVCYRKRLNHYRALKCEKQVALYNSLVKYGFDAHVFEILEDNVPAEQLSEREKFWIRECNSFYKDNRKGLNMNRGGGNVWTDEVRNSFGEKFVGEKNPFYGRKHSDETKAYLAKVNAEYNKRVGKRPPKSAYINSAAKTRKAVIVYNEEGNFIAEYNSLTECAKALEVPMGCIKDSVLYGSWIRGKYAVRHKKEDSPFSISVGKIKKAGKRTLYQLVGGSIKEYPSIVEASLELNIPQGTIAWTARRGRTTRSGHFFIYKDLYEKSLRDAGMREAI